jgi:hypothetical protein
VADVHLIWFTMDDTAVTAPRADVRDWAAELGVPTGPLTRGSTKAAFLKACAAARVKYSDESGREYLVTAREVARKDEFITFEVVRDDGMKLAQLKYFSARRGRQGIVAGTHVIKSIVRPSLDPRDAEAARAWLVESDALFKVEQGYVPWYITRRLVRAALELHAVPVSKRAATFFAYDDDMEPVHRAGEFLRRSVQDSQFYTLAIEDGSDLGVFATSADVFLLEQVTHLLGLMTTWMGNEATNRMTLAKAMPAWRQAHEEVTRVQARHERRLSLRLPQTSSALLEASQLMTRLMSSAHLPSVTP